MKNEKHFANIGAKMHENGEIEIHLDGIGFDLLTLSLAISKVMVEKGFIDVDDFCDVLKAGTPSDAEVKNAINKLIDDTFLN